MTPSFRNTRLSVVASLVFLAITPIPSYGVVYVLDSLQSGPTEDILTNAINLSLSAGTQSGARMPTDTNPALNHTGSMSLTLTAVGGGLDQPQANIVGGEFSYVNQRNPNDLWVLRYGTALQDSLGNPLSQFIVPADAPVVGITDVTRTGLAVTYTLQFYDASGDELGATIAKIVPPGISIDLLLFEITAGVNVIDIPNIRGMSISINVPNASTGSSGTFTSVILTPEPSRALLLALSLGLLMLRRRR